MSIAMNVKVSSSAYRGCVDSIAQPSNDSPSNEMSKVNSRTLQRSTNNHDKSAKEDGLPPSKHIANEDCSQGTSKASGIVTCD